MNCPKCASPLLFGATSCPCGYNDAGNATDTLPIEISYWEGLRAYWRIYWPTQVVGGLLLAMISRGAALGTTNLLSLAVQFIVGAVTLFLFLPRLFSRPYRGFSLVGVELATGSTTKRLRIQWRFHVWVFLWWRQILAGMIASVLSMPLNMLLSIMGLQVAQWVAVFAGILVVGPILLKMLIGHEFDDFRIEVRREQREGERGVAAATSG